MEFTFVIDHQAMFCGSPETTAFCGTYVCVLGTNPQKLIAH